MIICVHVEDRGWLGAYRGSLLFAPHLNKKYEQKLKMRRGQRGVNI